MSSYDYIYSLPIAILFYVFVHSGLNFATKDVNMNNDKLKYEDREKLREEYESKFYLYASIVALLSFMIAYKIPDLNIKKGISLGSIMLLAFSNIFRWYKFDDKQKFVVSGCSLAVLVLYVYMNHQSFLTYA
jgi:predicted histidine transporter YuiF (NhaC family)